MMAGPARPAHPLQTLWRADVFDWVLAAGHLTAETIAARIAKAATPHVETSAEQGLRLAAKARGGAS